MQLKSLNNMNVPIFVDLVIIITVNIQISVSHVDVELNSAEQKAVIIIKTVSTEFSFRCCQIVILHVVLAQCWQLLQNV